MDPVRAETYLRVLAESEVRRLPSASRRDLGRTRFWLAATTLVAAGGIDADTVQRMVADLDDAVALRSEMVPGVPGVAHRYRWQRAWPRPAAGPGGAGAGLRAVPAGAAVTLSPGRDGWRGEFRLLALVSAEGYAALTVAAQWVTRAGRPASRRPSHVPFDHVDAVDDQGRSYQVSLWDPGGVGDRVAQVARALTEGGAVPAGEPALAQLAALATALGLDLGIPDAGHTPLPEAWTSILGARRASDGPQGVAPFAVTLPEVDGASFALGGQRSWREAATLHVLAQGWQPYGWGWLALGGRDDGPPDHPISWRARDSTGRWHLVEQMNWGDRSDGVAQIQAHLTPPLHPAATALEVIITGVSGQVRATVPLRWQGAR